MMHFDFVAFLFGEQAFCLRTFWPILGQIACQQISFLHAMKLEIYRLMPIVVSHLGFLVNNNIHPRDISFERFPQSNRGG